MRTTPETLRLRALAAPLRQEGLEYHQIAAALGITKGRAYRLLNPLTQAQRKVKDLCDCGQPAVLSGTTGGDALSNGCARCLALESRPVRAESTATDSDAALIWIGFKRINTACTASLVRRGDLWNGRFGTL